MDGWGASDVKDLLAWATDAWGFWLIIALAALGVGWLIVKLGTAYIKTRFKPQD